MAPLPGSTRSSPRWASHTSSAPSGISSMPSGRPPVSATCSICRPSLLIRRMRPSSTPVTTLPSASSTTSSVPTPLTGITRIGGSGRLPCLRLARGGTVGGFQTMGRTFGRGMLVHTRFWEREAR